MPLRATAGSEPGHLQTVSPLSAHGTRANGDTSGEGDVNSIIYLVGLVVIVLFILSFLGLR